MFMEAAQALAASIDAQPGDASQKLRAVIERGLSRPAQADEITALAVYFERQRERFATGSLDPIKAGGAGFDANRAAWMLVARALLNTDEFVTKN